MNKNLINATDDQIKDLEAGSAFTFEGLDASKDSLNGLVEVFTKEQIIKPELQTVDIYTWKGAQMNALYHLTGDNAYKNDLTFVALSLDQLTGRAVAAKMMYGARWLDDIVDNNAYRERG